METLYERDLFAWAMRNAALLREGRLSEIDCMNIADELESMGRNERRTLESRLAILMMHLLKWRYQPERRGRSLRAAIREQQRQVARMLDDNPSLRPELQELIANTYIDAVLITVAETNLNEGIFPVSCPFVWERLMGEDEKQWD